MNKKKSLMECLNPTCNNGVFSYTQTVNHNTPGLNGQRPNYMIYFVACTVHKLFIQMRSAHDFRDVFPLSLRSYIISTCTLVP
ncbi:hypothetical protein NC651_016549 [Populus alba x Populus x berolinensis]|nr:hypothetical protein NC651_016549 [Populus alba x Populus x berolinensis]